jgi:imidazoleglycerol phosphate dehydratase HisB
VVLVDEAYIEFGGETFLPDLPRYPNVLVGRTFSKAYGLAGMRVGILIGQPQSLDAVRAVTLPFNINGVAMAATLAALEDKDFLPRYAAQVAESRTRLYDACRALGLPFWKSAANFVLVQVGDAVPLVVQALAARGVHVRDRSKDPTPRVHPHHGWHARPHRRRDRGAGIRVPPGDRDEPIDDAFTRETTETQIRGRWPSMAAAAYDIRTGIRFFDHMLELFTRHGGFDLTLKASGDLDVDQHHTVEDVGIAWANPLLNSSGRSQGHQPRRLLRDADGTRRSPSSPWILSGRPHAVVDLKVRVRMVGDLQTELVHDFFDGFGRRRAGQRAREGVVRPIQSSPHRGGVQGVCDERFRVACAKDKRPREDAAEHEGAAVIALVDYGAGNLTSVRKALSALGAEFTTPASADV